jgi:hypothetical protein
LNALQHKLNNTEVSNEVSNEDVINEYQNESDSDSSKDLSNDSLNDLLEGATIEDFTTEEQEKEIKYETHDIEIDSVKFTNDNSCNDYVVTLPSTYKNVNRVELVSADVPKGDKNITTCNNVFSYRINNKTETIEIDEDDYGIDDLLEVLKDELDSLGDSIEITPEDDRITISNSNNDDFDILVVPRSINKILGFTKKSYYGKSSYTGEMDYNIDADHQVYLFMEDISETPITELNLGKTDKVNNIVKTVDIPSLNKLHIKFKVNTNPKDNILYDFNGNSHKLHLKVNSQVNNED